MKGGALWAEVVRNLVTAAVLLPGCLLVLAGIAIVWILQRPFRTHGRVNRHAVSVPAGERQLGGD